MRLRDGTSDAYAVGEVRAYRALDIAPGDRALDLGGIVGGFGREAVDAGATVVAVEPEPSNVSMYRENVPEARVIQAAAGSSTGTAALWGGRTSTHSIIQRRGRSQIETVETITLPDLIADVHPTVIKCDIEGSEYDLDWTSLPGVRAIAMELHYTRKSWRAAARRLSDVIEAQGFDAFKPMVDTGSNWHCVAIWRRPA